MSASGAGAGAALGRTASLLPGLPAKRSFPPIVDERARVLVLGTLPGEESLRRQQYYAHPRNLFWPILFALFDAAPAADYGERLAFAAAWRVALWDVCMAGEREASADSTIRREVPNAIDRLLDAHPLIGAVAFNGSGARRLYDRHFPRRAGVTYLAMPSTSPAHARLDFAAKLAQWAGLRAALDGRA
ncbi:MAG TPA: DNA-deoxyinosine glycosylase [Stellaceae bacterium]|jgi:hypoxanthine-DNA glycosylase|nr:DNA-deoxyinosine glycosylase [Stellaceae bacterium]